MEQTISAIFYSQSDIWTAINNMRSLPGNIKVASPYISDKVKFDWKEGDCLLIALSETNVRKGFVNPFAVEELMDRGVKVYSNEKLHAKIYSKDDQAIICSCNLSYASQNEWLEAGVWVNDTLNLQGVASFFEYNLNESSLILKERLVELKDMFVRDQEKPKEQTIEVNFADNLWSVSLVDGEKISEDLQKKIQISKNEAEKDKGSYSYYHFRTSNNEFQVGDYIIQFKNVGGKMRIFFPARCVKVTAITDSLFMVHLRHKGTYEPMEWENAKLTFSDLDLSPSYRKIEQKSKVLQRLHHYFNMD